MNYGWLAVFVVIAVLVLRWIRSFPTPVAGKNDQRTNQSRRRIRLTDSQIVCLSSASESDPIYGENPAHMRSQMPNGAMCFNQKTVDSLVKRGFLRPDGRGGYLLTPEGADGLREGMGF